MKIMAWKKGSKAIDGVQYVRLVDWMDGVDLVAVNAKGEKIEENLDGGPHILELNENGIYRYVGVSPKFGIKLNSAGNVKKIT